MGSRKRKLPVVAICGRPNVGKSTLFNRITGKQRAIIHSEEGVTRDRAYAQAEWHGRAFLVVDTGGIVDHPQDPITHKIQQQVRGALEEAAVILFVIDGQQEITAGDEAIRHELYRLGKPVVLAVNKLDNNALSMNRVEFYPLGLGEPHAISSTHNLGIDDLMAAVAGHLPQQSAHADAALEPLPEHVVIRVAVVGKPNVGKSSFINAILNEERAIVDDQPGTTRDAIEVEFHHEGKDYLLIDTAGMRKKGGIWRHVERFSVTRALRSVRGADVCLVMADSTEGICEQDKRIINYVVESGTGMVLAWTKWDLTEDKEARFKALADEIDLKAPFLKYVPSITMSNVTRQRIFKVFESVDRVAAEAEKRIPTPAFNNFLQRIIAERPPSAKKGKHGKVFYGTQAEVKPTVFVLFVNQKELFHFSYLRYIENRLRDAYGFEGVPIRIEVREGKPRDSK